MSINVSVIDAVLHPPVELLQVTDSGLFNPYGTGLLDFTFPADLPGRPVYGFSWETASVAPGIGRTLGVITEYEMRVLQFVVFNSFHIFGPTFAAEIGATTLDSGVYLFQIVAPQGVSLYISPGFTVTLNWVIGFP